MRKIRNSHAALNLPTLKLEGGLFLPDQLEKAALGSAQFQSEADYKTPKGLKLKDDYSRAFQIASAQWKHFSTQLDRADLDAGALTHQFVQELLRDAFGYVSLVAAQGITVGDRHYPASLLAGNVPVVVAPHTLGLDDADPRFAIAGSGSRKKSAFQLAQELLNASPDHLWAIVSNGKQLRLLRDAATLTRPSFLEIDLEDLLGGQRFAEFANVWRLIHASRAGSDAHACIWEAWREAGQAEGTRVRLGLRLGVTDALLTLGEGFLQHPANDALRAALHTGELSKDAYFQQLLRLIYRFIFLFSVEERGLLHPNDDSEPAIAARRAYAEGYACSRLRELCLKRRARNRFDDQWQGLRIVFKGLAEGEARLALPALGGLFAHDQCPHLDVASLDNAHLLAAIQKLRWASHNDTLAPVDYRNMGSEELGSVYESLLELVPEIDLPARTFGFIGLTSEGSTAGNARKLTGSYYTPDSLVQELIRSALDPVIEQRLADNPANPLEALLSIRIVDPACGSGHFLLAAARRLAERLAQLRAPEGAVKPQDYRHALREVVARCIFGVDRNPMSLELARTALWLESFEEGKPLSFLDHHLQLGDALLGLTDLKALTLGIPKDAFKPLSGDDKNVCKVLVKTNAAALKDLEKKCTANAFGQIDVASSADSGLAALRTLEALPQDSTTEIAAKEAAYCGFLQDARNSRLAHAADLLLGAYLQPKTEATQASIPTTATLYLSLLGDELKADQAQQLAAARAACHEARVLHWPLAFPQVFADGGFDCVLGNPPWERIKLQEEEFFATRHRDVAEAKNKAERSQRIQWLSEGMLAKHLYPQLDHAAPVCEAEQRLYAEFINTRRTAEAASLFAHIKGEDGGRYPLTGVGDVNTYALFAETFRQITAPRGRAGFIVPSGLATDNTTRLFFGDLIAKQSLVSFYEFENEGFFPDAGQGHVLRFALTTIVGAAQRAEASLFLFQAKKLEDLHDENRVFSLSPKEIFLVNPNTGTCPIFRSKRDAEITSTIYSRVPVLVRDAEPQQPANNPWGICFQSMFHMANDSHLFKTKAELRQSGFELMDNAFIKGTEMFIPLYEAKLFQIYNHRHGDFNDTGDGERTHSLPTVPEDRLKNPKYVIQPHYWVPKKEVINKVGEENGFFAFRSINNSANSRAFVGAILPFSGVGHSAVIVRTSMPKDREAALWAVLLSIVFDYLIRQKLGGTNISLFILRQMPVPTPSSFSKEDLQFIVPRVLELTYTAQDMAHWAQDLGYQGPPFTFDSGRRSTVRAELDAYCARLYRLTRDELRYILDPADVMGEDYPSETFRVLKNSELREFGEYRTQRLVLEAWDKLVSGELH